MPSARPAPRPALISAAGAVVLRPGRDVLLVHRPKYDDWSFPKGKLERGEHVTAAAVREVQEETGLRVRLGRPLASQTYATPKGRKTVHYWVARTVDTDDVSGYVANGEIDEVAWMPVDKAARVLTYPHDRGTLAEALEHPKRTETLIVLRHADSRARSSWHGDDRLRPLLMSGHRQAERLAHVLEAYDVRRVLTSSSIRCVDTVAPYCLTTGTASEPLDVLSEESAKPRKIHKLVASVVEALEASGPTVICSHRPVLPELFEGIGVEDPGLEKGEMLVAHLRGARVVALERH